MILEQMKRDYTSFLNIPGFALNDKAHTNYMDAQYVYMCDYLLSVFPTVSMKFDLPELYKQKPAGLYDDDVEGWWAPDNVGRRLQAIVDALILLN